MQLLYLAEAGLSPVSDLDSKAGYQPLTPKSTIIGVFNTKNGNEDEKTPAYFSRWRYTPIAQAIDKGVYVSASASAI